MQDLRREIISALNEVRRRQNFTNEEMAKRMGVTLRSAATILSRLNTGRSSLAKMESIEHYAEALDVDIIYTARLLLPDGTEQTVTGIIPRPSTTKSNHKRRKP